MVMTSRQEEKQRERWRYVGALLGGLTLLVVLGIQLILLIPTTYTASSAIALRPLTAEQSADNIEMQAHEYTVLLGAKQTVQAVEDEIMTSSDRPVVTASATRDAGTATVRIETSSSDRQAAVDVANGLADQAQHADSGDQTAKVVVVLRAASAGVTSGPPRTLYVAALLVLAGLLLAGGLYWIRERLP